MILCRARDLITFFDVCCHCSWRFFFAFRSSLLHAFCHSVSVWILLLLLSALALQLGRFLTVSVKISQLHIKQSQVHARSHEHTCVELVANGAVGRIELRIYMNSGRKSMKVL